MVDSYINHLPLIELLYDMLDTLLQYDSCYIYYDGCYMKED